MSRHPRQRLIDIRSACVAIITYTDTDPAVAGMTFDAICMRLLEIGEAAKDLDGSIRARAPEVPWSGITAMRDRLAHRYFDTAHGIVVRTAHDDIPALLIAVDRLLGDHLATD